MDNEHSNFAIEYKIQNILTNLSRENFICISDLDDLKNNFLEEEEDLKELEINQKEITNLIDLCLIYEDNFRKKYDDFDSGVYSNRRTFKEMKKLRKRISDSFFFREMDAEEKLLSYKLFVELLKIYKDDNDPKRIVNHLNKINKNLDALCKRNN